MPRVELISDMECPIIQYALEALLEGFSEVWLRPSWTEWDRNSPRSTAYAAHYGSPTILVDGCGVAGAQPCDDSDSCRFYDRGLGGLRGDPPFEASVPRSRRRVVRARPHRRCVRYTFSRRFRVSAPRCYRSASAPLFYAGLFGLAATSV